MTKEEKEELQKLAEAMGLEANADLDAVVASGLELVALVDTGAGELVALVKPLALAIEAHADDNHDMPETPEGIVELGIALVGELATSVKRIDYLEEALEEASEALTAVATIEIQPPAYVVWCDTGRMSRGHVRRGTAASLALGDYELADLSLIAHKVITERQFGGYARKFGQAPGRAAHAKAANSPAEAAERAHRKARTKSTGPRGAVARFGELRTSAVPSPASSTRAPAGGGEAKPAKRNEGLRGDPKATRNS